jgi:hypothetical protein
MNRAFDAFLNYALPTALLLCVVMLVASFVFAIFDGINSRTPIKNRLVCFGLDKQLKLSMEDYDIHFDGDVIRFANNGSQYAIYPPDGYLCSIIKEPAKQESK